MILRRPCNTPPDVTEPIYDEDEEGEAEMFDMDEEGEDEMEDGEEDDAAE